ncbi:MBL fold metallo-hydrolase [Caldivirga maquilingensis]|uniref:Beta-lactamase domain protein n=1 Tax=Caldivirga maquilingensis (strain ATCC 700844 / DSM 13496 / JCM 10307 / IC-167) TaxID=397948 RepID=A8M8Y1_CALMQ|nr:MBL fold metallo-hydrolase [Caldivirga maquilingensis]ABW02200.1 beta-lactamase domain protein [Caldivirga maquilingensis IC-167]
MDVYVIRGMSNSYLTSNGLLIDAGVRVRDVLRISREQGVEVRYLLITHYHIDHIRYAWDIVKQFHCSVVASVADARVIEGEEKPRAAGFLQLLVSRLFRFRPVKVNLKVNDGDVIEGYEAIYAPGHTPGSTAYFKDGVLFSGDAIVEREGKPVLPPRGFTVNMSEAMKSFSKLMSLKPKVIYPGHGKPIVVG